MTEPDILSIEHQMRGTPYQAMTDPKTGETEAMFRLGEERRRLLAEADELRAEVKRLKAEVESYENVKETLRWRVTAQEHVIERLRAAAMKLDGYWINDTYDPSTKNVSVRESAFAELRDLLELKPKVYS